MKQIPNILLVDDIEENLFLLKSICSKLKANLIFALSGLEALKRAKGVELALAIIDVRMPEMDGYELALKMNEERSKEKVPIIFMTANLVNSLEVIEGYDSGAVDYITKPFNTRILLCKINIFLDLYNQKQTIIKNARLLKQTADELTISLEQQHQLTQHIEKAREQERVAISHELHDELGQALTAIKMDLSIIRQNVSDRGVVLKINNLSALVGDMIKNVQHLTSQLRPAIIDDLGLALAMEWYTEEYSQRYNVEILLDIGSTVVFSPDISLTIFRIMQESLTNIARHAKATTIDIRLFQETSFIYLMISDNGIGIKKDEIKSKNAFGILSMKERAASLGGTLDIYSGEINGTVIKLIFPLNIKK